MTKKCSKCQRSVDNPQDSSSYYQIVEFACNESTMQPKRVQTIYACEPCWYHQRESERYLNKPLYQITRYQINDDQTVFNEDREIQKEEILLINIYQKVAPNYQGEYNWQELQLLDNLLKREKGGVSLSAEEQVELKRLKNKYNFSSQSPNDRERERERAFWTISSPTISNPLL